MLLNECVAIDRGRALIYLAGVDDAHFYRADNIEKAAADNLTSASHVVHFDRWGNPAVENQATDRAYRIGQKRNVLAHKFVCRGKLADDFLAAGAEINLTEMTIEAKIDLLIEAKRRSRAALARRLATGT